MGKTRITVYNADGRICYHCRSIDDLKGISIDDRPEHSFVLCSKCRKELMERLKESDQK